MTDAPLDLDAIQARHDAATPGPWYADDTDILVGTPDDLQPHPVWIGETANPGTPNGGLTIAQFIAAARTDVEQLLARVRQLEAERALYVGVEPTIAEEMAELTRGYIAAHAVCDAAEKQATRWENPLPVPEWVAAIRAALDGRPAT
ncbi:hypothetical protein [Kitasatospora cathayae]|uniref:Uncharacterized protein n=1 Tax=Kitasatospora cathayae TaxID=3004092 RepID=A0ABY7Q9T3_9ACTN|nr:hypothetical protein [Kitasatospora sp. HUAS 3-15]WBP89493.1 hypothetical protein O1G21_29080 [Kitasatospora sp. HUAS 3-15]